MKQLCCDANGNLIMLSALAPSTPDGCLNLYTFCSYGGFSQQICADTPDLRTYAWNDLASSVMLGRGIKATLYSGINYTGSSMAVSSSCPCLTSDTPAWDKNISSIKLGLADTCVQVYPQCNYGGTPTTICDNDSSINTGFASIKVGSSVMATLYSSNNYASNSYSISNSNNCLTNNNAWSGTNSIRLSPLPSCVWAFTSCNYGGDVTIYCGSINNLPAAASSMKVGQMVNVSVYSNSGYSGTSTSVSSDQSCFGTSIQSIQFN